MFKLTYQAFVMFYLSSGYIGVSIIGRVKKFALKLPATLIAAAIISSLLIYPYFGIKSYYGELKTYRGLSGTQWLKSFLPGESQAIAWFDQNVRGQPIILEAPGDSYTDYNVISSYTGLPTVSGWFVHEWLWRGSPEIPQKRVGDISKIYLSTNVSETQRLLNKYQVEYVVVGHFEREKFPELNEAKFDKIGQVVFSSGGTKIYRINPQI
jgi:uncharacterized membrane protein